MSVVVTNFNLAEHLPATLASIEASTYERIEIIIVDDASTNSADRLLLEKLSEDNRRFPVTVIENVVNRGLAASRNIGVAAASGAFVMPLDADDCIAPGFIETAANALALQPDFDVVVPTGAFFSSDEALVRAELVGFQCFLGAAPTLGLIDNRHSSATSLMRRSVFERFSYDERLDSYEDWSLYLRLALDGVGFLVTNDIQFYYRRREGSMIRGISHERHQRLLSIIYQSLPSPLPASVRLEALALLLSWHAPPQLQPPLRHVVVDAVNDAIKRQPLVHRAMKAVLSASKRKQ